MNKQNQVLDWDGVLENDGSEFPVLPEGDYAFEVTGFERGSFPGSEKMCACNKETLTLKVEAEHILLLISTPIVTVRSVRTTRLASISNTMKALC